MDDTTRGSSSEELSKTIFLFWVATLPAIAEEPSLHDVSESNISTASFCLFQWSNVCVQGVPLLPLGAKDSILCFYPFSNIWTLSVKFR